MSRSDDPPGDPRFMTRALVLARRGVGSVSPNPPVGAVAVRDGQIVAEGWHRVFGGPHAEADLLARAALGSCEGAEIYVTLEPCAHHGKTPPCTDALIEAGFRQVYYAVEDPHPVTRGKGPRRLRRAGVSVSCGLLASRARFLLAPYLKLTTQGLPLVTAKWAMSLDGRVATREGHSQWISGEETRVATRRERSQYDAILVGRGTVAMDDPDLTSRSGRRPNPIRVVLDSRLRMSPTSRLLRTLDQAPVWIVASREATSSRAAAARARKLEHSGAEIIRVGGQGKGRLRKTLRALARRGVAHLLVEGGPTIHGAFLDARLVDRVQVVIGPRLIGGMDAPGAVLGQGIRRMAQAPVLEDERVRRVGGATIIEGSVTPEGRGAP